MISAALHGKLLSELHDELVDASTSTCILLIHLQEEATRVHQEAEEQLAELQQQLQQQLLGAGSLTERVLSAEASSTEVSMPAPSSHASWL